MVIMDSTLESLTPSVNAPLVGKCGFGDHSLLGDGLVTIAMATAVPPPIAKAPTLPQHTHGILNFCLIFVFKKSHGRSNEVRVVGE